MGDTAPQPRLLRRRIVERPRLLRALDDSNAQVKLLIAGPGYGKTTLLEQWASQEGRVVGWYRACASGSDVAVVARATVGAVTSILPAAGRNLLDRLAITEDPQREAVLLAELLAEDLREWPEAAWLAIDDYQHIAKSPACEDFVERLWQVAPMRLIVAGETRPAWANGRLLLDGVVAELGQAALAMNEDEIVAVRGATESPTSTANLADGWPVVVGLQAMLPRSIEPAEEIPEMMLERLVDAVCDHLEPELAEDLVSIASVPSVDPDLLGELLGAERARRVMRDAAGLGLLEYRVDRFELHPSIAAHLARRDIAHSELHKERLDHALLIYRRRKDWDSALAFLGHVGEPANTEDILISAVDDLLRLSRVATLEECVALELYVVLEPQGRFSLLGRRSLSVTASISLRRRSQSRPPRILLERCAHARSA